MIQHLTEEIGSSIYYSAHMVNTVLLVEELPSYPVAGFFSYWKY